MRNPFLRPDMGGGSFLPEDYVARKAETRASLISLALFGIVLGGVVAAFFVTNRQWLSVRREQELINTLYTQEARKIEQLKKLEAQKAEMLAKAEVTTALVEKVPRSVLLSELTTRMPESITLLELELKSQKIKEPAPPPTGPTLRPAARIKNLSAGAPRAAPGAGAQPEAPEIPKAPRLEYRLKLIGVAKENNDIADYLAALKACPLLEGVELTYIKETEIDKVGMRKFELECAIRKDADARAIEPALNLPMAATGARPNADAEPPAGARGGLTSADEAGEGEE